MIQRLKRLFAVLLTAAFTFVSYTQVVHAAMIGTDQVLAASAAQQNRAKIAAALDRPEVMAQLESLGVARDDARSRVAALTDEESSTLANQIDSLPAAGSDIVGALVLIFFVLLVTDILGLTKVFPFTRSRR